MALEIDIRLFAKTLGKDIELLGESINKNLKQAVKQLSLNVHAEADRLASGRLSSTRDTYRNALKYEQISDDLYVVYLEPSVNYLEEGWSAFDLKPGMLKGPKSRINKKGKRFNIIPLQQRPFSKEGKKGKTVGSLTEAIQSLVKDKSVEKSVKDFNDGTSVTYFKGVQGPLQGLTKVTKTYEKTKQSQYFLFRMVTDKSPPSSWQHPGFSGAQVFPDLERYVETNMRRILEAIA